MVASAVKVSGVSKRFIHSGTHAPAEALKAVDLEVRAGEIVAILGPNGAGKTTLLKILATLVLADSGDAWICGASVSRQMTLAKSAVSLLIADDRSFYPRLTGRHNLQFFAALSGYSRESASARIAEAAAILKLGDLDCAYQEYTTGAKQRLALARCLMTDAKVLLLDEPTRSLDPAAAMRFRRTLKEDLRGRRGEVILFTTHQPDEAAECADRIVVMNAGRIISFGTSAELCASPGSPSITLEAAYAKLTQEPS